MNTIQFTSQHVQFIGHLLAQLKINCTQQDDTILFIQNTFNLPTELLTQGFTSTNQFNIQITNTLKLQKQQQKLAQKEALKLLKQQQKQQLKLQKQQQKQQEKEAQKQALKLQKQQEKEALKLQKQHQKEALKLQKQPEQQLTDIVENNIDITHHNINITENNINHHISSSDELTLQQFDNNITKRKGRPKKNITITEQ